MVGVSASGFLDDRVFVCALGPNFVCVCVCVDECFHFTLGSWPLLTKLE